MHGISRRTLLTAGLGLVATGAAAASAYDLVEAGVLPGRYRLAGILGQCAATPLPPRGPLPAMRQQMFWSAYRQRTVRMVTLIPAGTASPGDLQLVVALHGLGGDAMAAASLYRAAMAASGVRNLAVVAVDGGNGYWHARADGDDPLGMIIHEVLPRAAAASLATGRIGVAGYSMGGFGALLLAERLAGSSRDAGTLAKARTTGNATSPAVGSTGSSRVAAVAAASPAIFASYPGARAADRRAFDGPADFARNNVLSGLTALRAVPVWVACGGMDPFAPMTTLPRHRLAELDGHPPAGGIEAGCHDMAFWASSAPAALAFLGRHLARRPPAAGR